MTIQVKYYWRELSTDGLLKEPPVAGPYYNTTNMNTMGWNYGYQSEEKAVEALKSFLEEADLYPSIDLVLVPIYSF